MRRHLASAVALLATITGLWLSTGAALAAGTPTTPGKPTTAGTPTTPTSPTPPPAPPPASVASHARLALIGTFTVHRALVTVPGRLVEVHGVVRPYAAGQSVKVRVTVGGKTVKTDRLRIKPAGGGAGTFTEKVHSPSPGIVRVTVTHARTGQMLGFETRRAFAALGIRAGFGAQGQLVDLVQQRLAALHLYMPQSGVFDQQTALALDAYHRLLGWGEGESGLDARTLAELLDGHGAFRVRYPHDGQHAEGDLGNQLLALIDGSRVESIYPISSGKPSTPTVLGHYRIYSRVPGYLPDGMYFSSFFYGGYAIHGYNPAPDYPASHGCMRLPISDAITVFRWLRRGDWVDVYR